MQKPRALCRDPACPVCSTIAAERKARAARIADRVRAAHNAASPRASDAAEA